MQILEHESGQHLLSCCYMVDLVVKHVRGELWAVLLRGSLKSSPVDVPELCSKLHCSKYTWAKSTSVHITADVLLCSVNFDACREGDLAFTAAVCGSESFPSESNSTDP